MRVVGKRTDDIYLIQVNEDQGRIVDFESQKRFPIFYLQSLIARGYWEKVGEEEEKEVLNRLADLKD